MKRFSKGLIFLYLAVCFSTLPILAQDTVTPLPKVEPTLKSPDNVAYVDDFLKFTLENSEVGDWVICPQYGCWYDFYTGLNGDGSYTTVVVPRVKGTYHVIVSVVVDNQPKSLFSTVEVLDSKAKPDPDIDKDKKDDGKKDDDKQDDKQDKDKKEASKVEEWMLENADLIVKKDATYKAELDALIAVYMDISKDTFVNYRAMAARLAGNSRDALIKIDSGSSNQPSADARWGTFINALGKKVDSLLGDKNQDIEARKEIYLNCIKGFEALGSSKVSEVSK